MTFSPVEVGEIVGLLAAMAWGATGLLVRAFGGGIHALVINALRNAISGVVFVIVWFFVSRTQPVPTAAWLFLGTSLVMGLGLGDSLYFEALKRIGVARAMPISMAYPVLAAIGAVALLHETLGPLAGVGILLTLAGVYLVAARPAPADDAPRVPGYWIGVALAATAAVSWSCSTLALGPAMALVDVPTASAIRTPLASALLFAAAGRARAFPKREDIHARAAAAILLIGLTSVASTGLFVLSVNLAGAGRAAVLTATSPLFAVPLSVLLLGEPGGWRIAAGTAISVLGVILLAR